MRFVNFLVFCLFAAYAFSAYNLVTVRLETSMYLQEAYKLKRKHEGLTRQRTGYEVRRYELVNDEGYYDALIRQRGLRRPTAEDSRVISLGQPAPGEPIVTK